MQTEETRLPLLMGNNGREVGSKDYFKSLHSGSLMPQLLSADNSVSYYDDLRKAGGKIASALSEVYDDLSRYIRVIRYIPKDNRVKTSRFILGLNDICALVGAKFYRTSTIVSILSLGDYNTNTFSRASDKEIEEAAKQIANGSFSLSKPDRIRLIEKVVDYGVKSAVGNDKKKAEFLSALKRGEDREFLKDVLLKMSFANSPRDFTGRCGRVICSREYIDHIEKHVFGANISNHYTKSNGDREYAKSVRDKLAYVAKQIASDLNGHGLTHDILGENQKRLCKAAEQLSKMGVRDLSYIGALLKPYMIPDITDMLNQIMIDSEMDVPAEFRSPMTESVINIMTTPMRSDPIAAYKCAEDIVRETKRMLYFKSMVESDSKYDLKLQDGWITENEYRYNGQIIRYDGPGNIAFGYFGLAMGIPEIVLLGGAGGYQAWQGNTKLEWWTSFFDDPYDREMIKIGFQYYKSRH